MTPTDHERALQAARALRERQPATLLLWRSLGNLSHGLLLPAVAIMMLMALATFSPADPAWSHTSNATDVVYQNSLGIYGAWFSDVAFWLFGKLAYALPILILLCNAHYWATYKVRLVPVYVGFATLVVRWLGFFFGFCSVLLCGSLMAHALVPDAAIRTAWQGIAGSGLSTAVLSLGPPAAFFVVLGLVSLSVTMLFERSYTWLLDLLGWPFVALFDKIAESIGARETSYGGENYARSDDAFQFDFDKFESAANSRREPEFSFDDELDTSILAPRAEQPQAQSKPLSAVDDDTVVAQAKPQVNEDAALQDSLNQGIEPRVTEAVADTLAASQITQTRATTQPVDADDDEFEFSLAATQRIGAAEIPHTVATPQGDRESFEDADELEPVFLDDPFDDVPFAGEQDDVNGDIDDDIDAELAREPKILPSELDEIDDFEPAERSAHIATPAHALHAEPDLTEAALAAKNFTLDSRAIANLRLHYSETQSLAPLLSTQTLRLNTEPDEDEGFAATAEVALRDEQASLAVQPALDLQATVDSKAASASAEPIAAMAVVEADDGEQNAVEPLVSEKSAVEAYVAEPVIADAALAKDLQASAEKSFNEMITAPANAEVFVADALAARFDEANHTATFADVTAGACAVDEIKQCACQLSDELATSAFETSTTAAEQTESPVNNTEEAVSVSDTTVAPLITQTTAMQLPPILEETLSGPLKAIPLLDQTLVEPLSITQTYSDALVETQSFRTELDEFSHIDYDEDVYSSPIKSSAAKRERSNGWLEEAADSLQALSDDLAVTQLTEPQLTEPQQKVPQLTEPAVNKAAISAELDDWDESDSLTAALDALANTSMFRPVSQPAAVINRAAEPIDVAAAIDTATAETVAELTAVPVSESSSVLPVDIEQQLSQTAKLLAADLAESLKKYETAAPLPTAQPVADFQYRASAELAAEPANTPSPSALNNVTSTVAAPAISGAEQAQPQAATSFKAETVSAVPVATNWAADDVVASAPAAISTAAESSKAVEISKPIEVSAPSNNSAPVTASAPVASTAVLREHPVAGPVIPVNPALAQTAVATAATTAATVTTTATPTNALVSEIADTTQRINFNSAQPVNMQGSFSAPALPVASADKHSLDIFASDPTIRRLSYNCATAVQVGDVGLPPLSLLRRIDESERKGFSEEKLLFMSRLLEEKLADFGVEIKVANVLPGPVITRFEVLPAPGIKASRISGLSTDLARSLAVTSVRVLEVIPGTSCVGIEVPNAEREMVYLGDVLTSDEYQSAQDPLTLALGYDISGQPAIANLGKMPHVLVAGTTGSGKSVGVNTMLLSMLFKASPEDVRLILVDPKFLELSVYEGIPHLLTPVITDMNIAANALRWAVGEMERRYQLMSKMGVRNLAGFNQKVVAAEQAGSPLEDPIWQVDPDDTSASKYVRPYLCKLPSIVIVIDEFADMMMMAGKKCETLITRIAQKARAAGIHLVLATQRPSVDVITGLIKANIPTRIAFTVSTKIDSRTILDQSGAEELLGAGDMLFAPPNARTVMRVHGAFVSDDEVHAVISDWCSRAEPNYLHSILEEQSGVSIPGLVDEPPADGSRPDDVLYDQVLDFILTTRKASISAVQRRFGIGYNRSAKIIESMEAAGVLGPAGTGAGNSRDILIGTHDD